MRTLLGAPGEPPAAAGIGWPPIADISSLSGISGLDLWRFQRSQAGAGTRTTSPGFTGKAGFTTGILSTVPGKAEAGGITLSNGTAHIAGALTTGAPATGAASGRGGKTTVGFGGLISFIVSSRFFSAPAAALLFTLFCVA